MTEKPISVDRRIRKSGWEKIHRVAGGKKWTYQHASCGHVAELTAAQAGRLTCHICKAEDDRAMEAEEMSSLHAHYARMRRK